MKKFLVGIFLITTICISGSAQTINWLSWEEAVIASKDEKRKFLVDIYTEWCAWCKKMDETTFKDPEIVKYINKNYYAIKFDAEQEENISVNGKVYKFNRNGGKRGYHMLAAELTRGKVGYPTVVFLDENLNLIQAFGGYRGSREFEKISKYFGGNYHQKVPWKKYSRNYNVLTGGQ